MFITTYRPNQFGQMMLVYTITIFLFLYHHSKVGVTWTCVFTSDCCSLTISSSYISANGELVNDMHKVKEIHEYLTKGILNKPTFLVL